MFLEVARWLPIAFLESAGEVLSLLVLRLNCCSKTNLKEKNFLNLFLAALDLGSFVKVFSSCSEWGLLFVAICGGFSCCGAQVLGTRALEHRLRSRGAWVQLLCSMWVFPDQASKLCPLHWQADSFFVCLFVFGRQIPNHYTTREVHKMTS